MLDSILYCMEVDVVLFDRGGRWQIMSVTLIILESIFAHPHTDSVHQYPQWSTKHVRNACVSLFYLFFVSFFTDKTWNMMMSYWCLCPLMFTNCLHFMFVYWTKKKKKRLEQRPADERQSGRNGYQPKAAQAV